jgi:hypothetical protein
LTEEVQGPLFEQAVLFDEASQIGVVTVAERRGLAGKTREPSDRGDVERRI